MDAFMSEAEAFQQKHFGEGTQQVNQPWHSHGPVFQIGGMAFFKGNAADPNDRCGNDSLSMNIRSMSVDGTCLVDGIVSYILIPVD
jgi:hypothetical protein